jgi:hypothetical protein
VNRGGTAEGAPFVLMMDEACFVLLIGGRMDIKAILQSQYLASLAMLKEAIFKCPPQVWDVPEDTFKFWSKAYHTVFYAHLYLQQAEKDFVEWEKHHDPDGDIPFTKDEVLEYLALAEQEVRRCVPVSELEADSGFHWYPVNKLEMHLINIRHIQQHAGEMYECLGMRENIELHWVGHTRTNKEQE